MVSTGFRGFSQNHNNKPGNSRPDKLLRWAAAFTLGASIVDLIVAVIYDSKIKHAPVFDLRPNNGILFLYSLFVPLLSTALSLLLLLLHARFRPRTTIPLATTALIGYIIILSIWTDCELTGPIVNESGPAPYCPQYGLGGVYPSKEAESADIGYGAGAGKMAVGWVAVVGWLGYCAVAVYGVVTRKKQLGDYGAA
ncbi:MAG: hypothetical protein M1831_007249 [Alyxoria varia]|nr:MAG: hypothetical protein M1831_007249 [Alyxoria varia]